LETRSIVLKGAKDLFFKYGIKSVTMDDIAKHLGISKKTIYQYFTDKNAIIKNLIEEVMHSNSYECNEIAVNSGNAIEEILELMKHLGSMFSKMNPNLFYDMQKYHPESWKLFKEFKEKIILNTVEKNLEKGINEGLYRKGLNIKIIARLRIEQIEFAVNSDVFPPEEYRFIDVHTAILDHYLHGIVTLKGHKIVNKFKGIEDED
jgi:AcrR family transcriptional regulator